MTYLNLPYSAPMEGMQLLDENSGGIGWKAGYNREKMRYTNQKHLSAGVFTKEIEKRDMQKGEELQRI